MNVFVNTRPKGKSGYQLGMSCVDLPLLEILAFHELPDQAKADLVRFINGEIATVVVVSVEAVRCALAFLRQYGIHHASDLPHKPNMIAVGKPTAQALARFGFCVMTPEQFGLPMSNEGMLAMPICQTLTHGDRLMIWRGVGGRRLLHDELVGRGVHVVPVAFYERCVPSDLAVRFEKICQNLPKDAHLFVLISSAMSLQAWQSIDRGVYQTSFLALGVRLTGLVKKSHPNSRVVCIDDLEPSTILMTLQRLTHDPDL